MRKEITSILSKLPKKPGVYLMKDKSGTIIYTGKSVNLKSRVSSYFVENAGLNFAKKKMVEKVADIEWIETANEVEALVLETNLIKKHLPKYNILMKDDKNLTYIKITDDPIPEVIKTRKREERNYPPVKGESRLGGKGVWKNNKPPFIPPSQGGQKSEYFWPYTSTTNITLTLKALRQIFRIRSCRVAFARNNGELEITSKAGRSIPCLDYYIGICPAPCTLETEKLETHAKNIESLKDFLKGNTGKVLVDLENSMKEKAKNLEFEEAAKIKTQIESIREISVKQVARDTISGDADAFVFLEKYDRIFAGIAQIRAGEIVSVRNVEIETRLGETKEEIIAEFLGQEYVEIVNCHCEERSDVAIQKKWEQIIMDSHAPLTLRSEWRITLLTDESFSSELGILFKSLHVTVETPSIWPKRAFLDFARMNLLNFAQKLELSNIGKKFLTRTVQENILTALGYEVPKKWPIIFECYDISHIGGTHTVASRSVIVNGKSETGKYKRYRIRSLADGMIDDFASMREVLTRRTKEAIEIRNWPNLIIIDGGKGQLSAALGAIEKELCHCEERSDVTIQKNDFQTDHFALGENRSAAADHASVSQSETRSGWQIPQICSLAKREEEVFVPGKSDPILFQKGTPELMLIQKIRDEAHRFAIIFNRESRNKAMKKNILDELPRFGTKTRIKLLKLVGSVDEIKNTSEEQLLKILNRKQFETLKDHGLL